MPGRDEADALNRETERLRKDRERREREQAERDQEASADLRRRTTEDNLETVRNSAHQLQTLRETRLYLVADIENWEERNHRYRNLDAWTIASHVMWSVSPISVVVTDTLLLSVAGRELLRSAAPFLAAMFGNAGAVIPIAIFLFAVGYITLELCTGHELDAERGGRRRVIRPFSVVMCLALPVLVIGFSLINAGLISGNAARPIGSATFAAAIIRAAGLGAVAVVAHGFILFFGGRIVDGFGYDVYKGRQIQLRRRLDRCDRQIAAETPRVEGGFTHLYNEFNNDNGENGSGGAGPFGATTRRVVNDVFDDDIIEEPAGRPRSADADHTEPHADDAPGSQTQNAAGNGPAGSSDSDPGQTRPGTGYDMDGEDEIRR
ncbi:MAG: hypothetical protein IPL32_03895 [Chloracidobacterium sp.]|nr:hypothetical protein [Chloracidobacterium sp.]